ncbi:MAG: DUF1674 domain-containing protein [Alphaproteobacteria bacterium]|nr:DUF1674 domain-containing protein [Alphaproteobacteria bacterium]
MKTQAQSPEKPKKNQEKPVLGHVPIPDIQREYGGRKGPEATRYGDWENNGKCVDF